MAERSFLHRILRLEAGIALGQWAYERVVNNWALLAALFVGGGGMSYLASISAIIEPLGPVGIGGIGLISTLLAWIGLAWARSLRAKASERLANAEAIEQWKDSVDSVNPLANDFQRQRVKILELAHPVTKHVSNKRFIDCQLIGPANIMLLKSNSITKLELGKCDLIVMNPAHKVLINNVVTLENCQIINCEILNCTLFLSPSGIPMFQKIGAKFVSFTGDPQIDSPPQGDTGQKKQP